MLSTVAANGTDRPQDEISRLVEDSVDQRIESAVGELNLEQLIGEARQTKRGARRSRWGQRARERGRP